MKTIFFENKGRSLLYKIVTFIKIYQKSIGIARSIISI